MSAEDVVESKVVFAEKKEIPVESLEDFRVQIEGLVKSAKQVKDFDDGQKGYPEELLEVNPSLLDQSDLAYYNAMLKTVDGAKLFFQKTINLDALRELDNSLKIARSTITDECFALKRKAEEEGDAEADKVWASKDAFGAYVMKMLERKTTEDEFANYINEGKTDQVMAQIKRLMEGENK